MVIIRIDTKFNQNALKYYNFLMYRRSKRIKVMIRDDGDILFKNNHTIMYSNLKHRTLVRSE